MKYTDFKGYRLSMLGLGCSRLGSFGGATPKEAEIVIQQALERGVNFFDTASSYGQGDSELVLGRILRSSPHACIATKVGKIVPIKAKLLRPVKSFLRAFMRGSSGAGDALRRTRGDSLPTCFKEGFLQKQLENSIRRLGMDSIPLVMLHSPSAEVLNAGDAVAQLEKNKKKGYIRSIGVSVDDINAAESALQDDRIEAIQVPVHPGDETFVDWARRARQMNRLVIAREIFKGLANRTDTSSFVKENVLRVAVSDLAQITLVGTTKVAHLNYILDIADSATKTQFEPQDH